MLTPGIYENEDFEYNACQKLSKWPRGSMFSGWKWHCSQQGCRASVLLSILGPELCQLQWSEGGCKVFRSWP